MGQTFHEIYIDRGDTGGGNFATRVNGASSKFATGVNGNGDNLPMSTTLFWSTKTTLSFFSASTFKLKVWGKKSIPKTDKVPASKLNMNKPSV
jgi:hypothetical protein